MCEWYGVTYFLECMDAAGRVSHPSSTRRDARRGVRRGRPRVGPRLGFFFFPRIRAAAARFVPNRLRFAPNRADSAKIGPYRPYQVVSADTAETGRNTAETGRNMPEMAENSLDYGRKIRNLHSSFFFCESRHSMCFLKIF